MAINVDSFYSSTPSDNPAEQERAHGANARHEDYACCCGKEICVDQLANESLHDY